jgi:hypothetical protein
MEVQNVEEEFDLPLPEMKVPKANGINQQHSPKLRPRQEMPTTELPPTPEIRIYVHSILHHLACVHDETTGLENSTRTFIMRELLLPIIQFMEKHPTCSNHVEKEVLKLALLPQREFQKAPQSVLKAAAPAFLIISCLSTVHSEHVQCK